MESDIIYGDAWNVLPTLPESSTDLVLTDPPYQVSRKSNYHTMGRAGVDFGSWDKEFDQFSWIDLIAPLVRPKGSVVIWNDWKKLGDIAKHLEGLGFEVKRMLTWHKTNPAPFNCNYGFVSSTEHAVWAIKKGKKGYKKTFNGGYHHGVFRYPVVKHPIHKTKKPDDLFKEIIEILTNPGDWILDPFSGVGTTAYAAEITGRNHLSIEIDKAYHKSALQHWDKAKILVK